MSNMIQQAVRKAHNQIPQSFEVASYWNDLASNGVILINTQGTVEKYAIWYVDDSGNRFNGGYYKSFQDASKDFGNRVTKLMKYKG